MICLNEAEITYVRETLELLLVVHSSHPDAALREQALRILKTDGAVDTNGAQLAILKRVIKISEKFL